MSDIILGNKYCAQNLDTTFAFLLYCCSSHRSTRRLERVYLDFLGEGKGLIIVCCLILQVSGGKIGNVESSSYYCKKKKKSKLFKNLVSSILSSVEEAEWCIFKEGGKTLF